MKTVLFLVEGVKTAPVLMDPAEIEAVQDWFRIGKERSITFRVVSTDDGESAVAQLSRSHLAGIIVLDPVEEN